jgi:hypothetical protein
MLSVRDSKALEVINSVRPGIATQLPDPALFLPISASVRVPARDNGDEIWIGLNLAFHGKEVSSLVGDQFPVVVETLSRLKRERRCKFFYFVHYDSERLLPTLFRLAGIATTVVDCAPPAMLAWYRQLDVHVAGMLHSAIFATAVDVPSIHIAYDLKGVGFFESMGMEDRIVPARNLTVDALYGQLSHLIDVRGDARREISNRRELLKRDLQGFLRQIPPLLEHQAEGSHSPVPGALQQ